MECGFSSDPDVLIAYSMLAIVTLPPMTFDPDFMPLLRRSTDRLLTLIDRFGEAQVLVVGDLTLDEFLTGYVERISREAPVPIIRHERTRQVPGGGANAVYNLAKLGANVQVAGFLGDDVQGLAMRQIFEAVGIDTTGALVEAARPTVTKTRISAHSRQSVTQQIVRFDRKSDDPPTAADCDRLAEFVADRAPKAQAVVCSDYGDGVFSSGVIQAALTGQPVIVDAQKELTRYRGATWFTPNLPEAEREAGFGITDQESLLKAGATLLAKTEAEYVLITCGESGMSLFGRSGEIFHIPAFNRAEVFDVTGAGDTVVAALTLGYVLGATPWEAAVLGNLAASLVVRHIGTATTSRDEMKRALKALLDRHEGAD